MNASDARRLGCGILIGAAIALPAGVMLAGRSNVAERPTSAGPRTSEAPVRNVYSPNMANDPYVIEQQRKTVEALELQCRQTREHCAEARETRRWLDQRSPPD